jgi:elongation factor Ts
MSSIDQIKKLRDETGAGVMDAKRALEESSDDFEKARTYLKEKGIEKAAKKSDREIKAGRIFAYVHGEGAVGTMVKLGCETDFVAKNDEFEKLGNEIAMQVAAMKPESVEDLLEQDYIRDPSKKVNDLITEAVAKIGENITIAKTACFEV